MGSVTTKEITQYVKGDNQAYLAKYYAMNPPPVAIDAILDTNTKYRAINLAIEANNASMVLFLINMGANFTLIDTYGNTPLMQCITNKPIFDIFLQERDTHRRNMLVSVINYVKQSNTSIVSELIMKQLWDALLEVLRILKQLDPSGLVVLLCLPNKLGNTPLYNIFKKATEVTINYVLDLIEDITDIKLNNVISNDTCLKSISNQPDSLVHRVKLMHHNASTAYTDIMKMCNSNPNIQRKLLLLDLDNNVIKNYEKNIALFMKADAIEYVPILITEKLSDEHYSALFSETVKHKFVSTYKIPMGIVLKLENVHIRDTIMKTNKENMSQSTPTYFRDILGQNHAIQYMTNETIPFIRRARKFNIKLTSANFPARLRRFLFYGPGGTGKSLLSRTLAYELKAPFIRMKIDSTQSRYYGDTEANLRAFMDLGVELAHTIDHVTGVEPGICVVIIEEFDAIGAKVVDGCSSAAFLTKINAAVKQILEIDAYPELIICASVNKIGILDPPIKQRLSTPILIALPDAKTRCDILLHNFHKAGAELNPTIDLKKWANNTELYSGREIADVAQEIINKSKRISQKWLCDTNDGSYFPMIDVKLEPDFEGSADDLEFSGKKYKNLWISDLETSKTRSLSDENFLEYMRDAVDHDPCAKQIFCKIREKLEKTENPTDTKTDIASGTPPSMSNLESNSTTDTTSDTTSNSTSDATHAKIPDKTSEETSDTFNNLPPEIWKVFLEFLNGGEKKEDYKHLTKSMFEMIQKHVNSYKLKVTNEGTLLDKWEILVYYKYHDKTIFFSTSIPKKSTILDLRKLILENDEIQKEFNEQDDSEESGTTIVTANILLVSTNTSSSLLDTDIIEKVLEHYATVQVIKNS